MSDVSHNIESDSSKNKLISPMARHHNEIRKEISNTYPSVGKLINTQPLTAFALPIILSIHWGAAYLASQTNVFIVFLMALFFGQIVLHSASILVHETSHKLIFKGRLSKLSFDLGLEFIISSFAQQLMYQHLHISSHHPYLGVYERDYEHEDMYAWRARQMLRKKKPKIQRLLTIFTLFLHALPLGSLIGYLIIPRLYKFFTGLPVKDPKRKINATRPKAWEVGVFVIVSLISNIIIFSLFGFLGWLYHIWSISLLFGKCGVTLLGQSLSEHGGKNLSQPTASTYWWGNPFFFNAGYHNEHHTFPNVAWSNLPKLRVIAKDFFTVEPEKSYFGLWWDHVKNDFSPIRLNPYICQGSQGEKSEEA